MSKLDELIQKLEQLEAQKKSIDKEINDLRSMLDVIKEVLAEQKASQEEALATLITKRDNDGRITDSDFLEFGRDSRLSLSGLIDEPEPPGAQEEVAQVA